MKVEDRTAYKELQEAIVLQMTEIKECSQVKEIVDNIRKGEKYIIFQSCLIPSVAFTKTISVQITSVFMGKLIAYLEVDLPKPYNTDYSISENTGCYFLKLSKDSL